jgi:hypothetical protein
VAESRIGVVVRGGVHRVIARVALDAGEVVMEAHGRISARPTRHSVQVGAESHLQLPDEVSPGLEPERYGWRYLNHACEPSAAWRGRTLFLRRPLAPGDEIAFDYNTTEREMATPFRCRCGRCDGAWVKGFVHLDPAAQALLIPHAAPWLR